MLAIFFWVSLLNRPAWKASGFLVCVDSVLIINIPYGQSSAKHTVIYRVLQNILAFLAPTIEYSCKHKIYILYFHTIFSDVQNNASIASLRLAVAAAQHGAVNVEEAVAGGVAAEEARLVAVVDGEAVAVAEAEVAVLVPDRAVAVPAALVVHRHPVGPILPVSDDSLQNQEVRK